MVKTIAHNCLTLFSLKWTCSSKTTPKKSFASGMWGWSDQTKEFTYQDKRRTHSSQHWGKAKTFLLPSQRSTFPKNRTSLLVKKNIKNADTEKESEKWGFLWEGCLDLKLLSVFASLSFPSAPFRLPAAHFQTRWRKEVRKELMIHSPPTTPTSHSLVNIQTHTHTHTQHYRKATTSHNSNVESDQEGRNN